MAVYQGRLIDHDAAFGPLLERVNVQYPDAFVLIRPIRDENGLAYVTDVSD